MKKGLKIISLLTLLLTLNSCGKNSPTGSGDAGAEGAKYHKISYEEAKKQMDENSSMILLDVRSQAEYDEKHIEGAMLIPDTDLKDKAELSLPDKDSTILIYCRSGRRSKSAAELLVSMGYTKVYDFGGIEGYPYETV